MIITAETILFLAQHAEVYADTPSWFDYKYRVLTGDVSFKLSNGRLLTIERGFEWDETTVMWVLLWAFPKAGKYAPAALVHDALYYEKYGTRKDADIEFKFWLEATMCSKFQALSRYYYVRALGWIKWYSKPSKRAIKNWVLISIT